MNHSLNTHASLSLRPLLILAAVLFAMPVCVSADDDTTVQSILFDQVRVFHGPTESVSDPTRVLIRGNQIARIGDDIEVDADTRIIDGAGHTLMPGLIDAHYHLTFSSLSTEAMHSPDFTPEQAYEASAREAEAVLMRGFTAVRDAGGPIWDLRQAISQGHHPGPRVWASGAMISQTSGHGDFRTPDERSRRFFGKPSRAELMGASFIADGRGEVLTAVRENLRFGASQIKVTAGGGTSSAYDPVDVTQYTLDEMRAAVEAAEDWGTYVTVHAYTPRAIRRAIEAGVKVIDHGQLLDQETMQLIKDNDVWLSLQVLRADSPNMEPMRRAKRRPIIENQPRVWTMARDLGVNIAWGTDFLFEPELNHEQNDFLVMLREWFSPAEVLRIATYDNARLLALSGLRSPYQGRLGVVEPDALADLLLVRGNPVEDLSLIADPEQNFVIIMKDGRIYKDLTGVSD